MFHTPVLWCLQHQDYHNAKMAAVESKALPATTSSYHQEKGTFIPSPWLREVIDAAGTFWLNQKPLCSASRPYREDQDLAELNTANPTPCAILPSLHASSLPFPHFGWCWCRYILQHICSTLHSSAPAVSWRIHQLSHQRRMGQSGSFIKLTLKRTYLREKNFQPSHFNMCHFSNSKWLHRKVLLQNGPSLPNRIFHEMAPYYKIWSQEKCTSHFLNMN